MADVSDLYGSIYIAVKQQNHFCYIVHVKFFDFLLILIKPTIFVTLVGTVVVFSPPSMLVFLSWRVKRKKSTLGGKELRVQLRVSQLIETRIVGLG